MTPNRIRTLLLSIALCAASPAFCSATNVYVTPSGTATGACPSGTGTSPNFTPSQFNTVGNWGSGTGQIGPGTTVELCGTFTGTAGQSNLLYFHGSGTSGSPITITCDTGVNITAPYWDGGSGAPITISGQSYITLNLSGCTIQNTENGTDLTYSNYSTGIYVSGSNITVENGTVSNICQHTSVDDHSGCVTSGNLPAAIMTSGSNITVQGMEINDSAYGIYHNAGSADSNILLTHNTITRCNQHIAIGTASSANNVSNITVSFNNLTDAVNWDDGVTDTFHHNAIFLFNGSGGVINGALINSNYMGGDFGENDTSYTFIDENGGTIEAVSIINNLYINGSASNGPANGFITGAGPSGQIYNNTIFCNGLGFAAMKLDNTGSIVKNNIISTCSYGIYVNSGSTVSASDYNDIYDLTTGMYYNGTGYASVAAWTSGTTFDSHSSTGNPNLSASDMLSGGSAAIQAGANLAFLCGTISALCTDKAGVARPASGTWEIGAYQSALSVVPAPPTTLTGVPH